MGRRVDPDRATHLGGGLPERVVVRVVQLLVAAVGGGSEHHRLEAEFLDAPSHLDDRRVVVLERHDADSVETVGRGGAVVAQPVVVGATRRAEQFGVVDPREHRGGVEDRDVDALVIHVDQSRVGVVPTGATHLGLGFFVPGLAADVGRP